MKCLQITKLISDAQERELNFNEKIGVKTHVILCTHCRAFQLQCKQLHQLMKQFAGNKPQ
ncbi:MULTISPECIES: zf-HC2 domain-containing protein [unclassified Lonepinella]|uniref:anti-sigma factor family protein n=1 Tax=unclassified Lonepinella TaxID=2642006 RepID=UPI0036DC7866